MYEQIQIGGKRFDFDRFGYSRFEREFGYRTKTGQWNVPKNLTWSLPDGHQEVQLWLMDMTDREDVLTPNYVTKDTLKTMR